MRVPSEERRDGIPITALREISILRSLKHTNIVNVMDVAVGDDAIDDVYMVMDYAEQVGLPREPLMHCLPYWLISSCRLVSQGSPSCIAHCIGLPLLRLQRRRVGLFA